MYKVGFGYDIHRFDLDNLSDENHIILCGVKIVNIYKIISHSDGDIPVHALMDALLGACGLDDIGCYFPNNDPQYKDISSLLLLTKVNDLIATKGFNIVNIDITIVCENPKINTYKLSMINNLSSILKISKDQIAIKATTNEGLGDIGKGNGICSMANVMLIKT
ncbi:MAG: 2-C-methyl-D-erythritol 2,4-cyclodiphosphate synthase [Anaplasmataceae bacterium]|nr:2-C-methyl-D-erythritol 2,4-cyclodiphosphate synthase [Anaplasmataceae bacterium]